MIDFNQLFEYNEETGIVTNKIKYSQRVKVGVESGHLNSMGYRSICINGKHYYTHRVIWKIVHGYFPEHCIDHINGIKDDNRLCNLREVSQVCNLQNTGMFSDNTSGYKGVSFQKGVNRWRAYANVHGKRVNLGYYDTAELAGKARKDWEESCNDWTCDERNV